MMYHVYYGNMLFFTVQRLTKMCDGYPMHRIIVVHISNAFTSLKVGDTAALIRGTMVPLINPNDVIKEMINENRY